ncbi:MAG: hypothetical protein WAN11_22640, partial [Syntrophobacteraceae bacterium]
LIESAFKILLRLPRSFIILSSIDLALISSLDLAKLLALCGWANERDELFETFNSKSSRRFYGVCNC